MNGMEREEALHCIFLSNVCRFVSSSDMSSRGGRSARGELSKVSEFCAREDLSKGEGECIPSNTSSEAIIVSSGSALIWGIRWVYM